MARPARRASCRTSAGVLVVEAAARRSRAERQRRPAGARGRTSGVSISRGRIGDDVAPAGEARGLGARDAVGRVAVGPPRVSMVQKSARVGTRSSARRSRRSSTPSVAYRAPRPRRRAAAMPALRPHARRDVGDEDAHADHLAVVAHRVPGRAASGAPRRDRPGAAPLTSTSSTGSSASSTRRKTPEHLLGEARHEIGGAHADVLLLGRARASRPGRRSRGRSASPGRRARTRAARRR